MNVCVDGQFFPADAPLLPVQNSSYKWGDGVFETMKVFRGKLLLEELHFERLAISLRLLQIEAGKALEQKAVVATIYQLCQQNNCSSHARVRLAVFRGNDNRAGYSIEAMPLDESSSKWRVQGLTLLLYPFARKSMDAFANLKSANFLPYVLASRYAAENGFDDAVVLNANNYLCDTSRANLFLLKGRNIYTPALHQGCVNGVMRRMVVEEVKKLGFRVYQDVVEEEHLLVADEVFLTNAIQGIRWVEMYKGVTYECTQTFKIFNAVSATIFGSLC